MATTSMLSTASERVTADPPKKVCYCVAGVYAGYFANALGKLNPKPPKNETSEMPEPKRPSRITRWAALVLRTWAIDPEKCPKCGQLMKRSRAILEREELRRLLRCLGEDKYPPRPCSPPPPDIDIDHDGTDPIFPDDVNQVPPDWDSWNAA